MRLSDINDFIDEYRCYSRAHQRAFGCAPFASTVQLPSASALCDAATLCDAPISSMSYDDGDGRRLSFAFRGVTFEFWGRE